MLRLYVSCATFVLHACQAGVCEKKNNRVSHNAQSQRAFTTESDAGMRWRDTRDGFVDGQGGRGLRAVFSSGRARQKFNGRVLYLAHEAGCKTHLPRSMSMSVCM
jgi:hypothetical protein